MAESAPRSASQSVFSSPARGARSVVFLAHQEENLGRWLAPQLLIALRETSLLCLVDGVRSTSPGLREATAALRSSKNLSLSSPSHPFLPGIKSSSLFPSSLNLSRGSSHSPCSLPRSPEWGGGGGGGVRVPDCARVPPKSRETRLPPLLPPPLTSFPLTSRRCCSKNKGRGHRSLYRAGLGSQEPRPTPASSGATSGNASSSVFLVTCAWRPAGRTRPAGAGLGPRASRAGGVLGGR